MILAVAGRRIDAAGAAARFPPENTQMVGDSLRRLFTTERVKAVVTSAACGVDLLALREAGALGLGRHVVLPFDRAAFRASSVVDRPGDWGPLYDTTMDQVAAAGSVTVLGGTAGDEGAYARANEAILEKAAAVARATNDDVCALLAWDGTSRGDGDVTEAFGNAARSRGWRVLEVLTLRTCFVIQGFGEKTDLSTGRVLNLDASYEVIKEAVQQAGLRCVRADEIIHSGTIDKPMYEWLFRADLVIADLSTYNVNAAYELGLRYGVRPGTTMIVAENGFKNPFDVGHIVTLGYEHLGKDIGRKEAKRFQDTLVTRIRTLMKEMKPDSPVYGTFLTLRPPVEIDPNQPIAAEDKRASAPAAAVKAEEAVDSPAATTSEPDASAKDLLAKARKALDDGRFLEAKGLLIALHAMLPRDISVVQRLALATYKSRSPDPAGALREALGYLKQLGPETTNDPETLGLWGAIHKRLWDLTTEREHLDEAVASYERGFYLKQDYYNGINLAFLLNVRAQVRRQAGDQDEAIADYVLARRARRTVLEYCERALTAGPTSDTDRYWIVATQWEAAVGLEDQALIDRFEQEAKSIAAFSWMIETTQSQIGQLKKML